MRANSATITCFLVIFSISSNTMAGPEGGSITNGAGSIDTSGATTTIHQQTSHMAIDWQSYDVSSNERVHYIQPDANSISLNNILSNHGSQIHGRIDANGTVVLVNPNGVFFGKDATVNVGGLIASGLYIDPDDFINGEFVFEAIEGTGGQVINSGIINAALGGSVALIGQQVGNEGLISAQLGAVSLAAGKEAVVTFDQARLMGVRVSKAVLQQDLGVDPAIVNGGEINAAGGRILLSGSVSRDIFSSAVNSGGMSADTSVVVNEDGSFTLGTGADVLNTGELNVSATEVGGDAGQIAVIGENVTNTGVILADIVEGQAGSIELHSATTTRLTGDSQTRAMASAAGTGGDIKVLGSNVGVFDQAIVDASGAQGGGQILIGGDKTGANNRIRNADFIYLGEDTRVSADGLVNGAGGKLIAFAQDTARIYGELTSRGGQASGSGGFVETSGLKGFEITNAPELSAVNGGGEWLIDPFDIEIVDTVDMGIEIPKDRNNVFESTATKNQIAWSTIETILSQGKQTVTLQTGGAPGDGQGNGDITLSTDAVLTGGQNSTLVLDAHGDIIIDNQNISVANASDSLNLQLKADENIAITGTSTIDTSGGSFTATAMGSFTSENTIYTAGADNNSVAGGDGGNIEVNAVDIIVNFIDSSGGNSIDIGSGLDTGGNAGKVKLTVTSTEGNSMPSITVNGDINTQGGVGSSPGKTEIAKLILEGDGASDPQVVIRSFLTSNIKVTDNTTGTSASSTLVGPDQDSLWTVTDINANGAMGSLQENIDTPTPTIDFTGIDDLSGISENDRLVVGDDRDYNWTINAEGGTLDRDGKVEGKDTKFVVVFNYIESLVGGGDVDIFTMNGENIAVVIDGGDGYDRLIGFDSANTWDIGTIGSVSVRQLTNGDGTSTFSNIESLEGSSGEDTFNIRDGGFSETLSGGDGADIFNVMMATNGRTLSGGAGADIFNMKVAGIQVTIDGGEEASDNNSVIDRLVAFNDSNTWTIDSAEGGTLTSGNGDSQFINIERLEGGGTFNIDTDIVNAQIISSGNVTINTSRDNIELNGDNDISGIISLGASDSNISLTNIATVGTQFGTINTTDLTVTSLGPITDTDGQTITVSGITTLNAGSNSIELDNTGNDFAAVIVDDANNLELFDQNTLLLNSVNVDGDMAITAIDDISLGSLTAENGKVTVISSNGAIIDGNGSANNITANSTRLQAQNGIGSNNSIEIDVDRLSAENGSGVINLTHSGDNPVTIDQLRNAGNITLVKNGVGDIRIAPGVTIDAGKSVGALTIKLSSSGSIIAESSFDPSFFDLRAKSLDVFITDGNIGESGRPLNPDITPIENINIFSIDSTGVVVGKLSFGVNLFLPPPIVNELLVASEGLYEIDTAVFAILDEGIIGIMLPPPDTSVCLPKDQLYGGDECANKDN